MTQSISNMSQVWMSNTNTYNSIAMSVSTLGAGANVNSRLLTFNVDNNTVFDVSPNGNMGIGRKSSFAKLDVAGFSLFGNYGDQYQGFSLQNNANSAALLTVNFIDFRNDLYTADAHIFSLHETNGGSRLYFGTTPPGSRASDRRLDRLVITPDGKIGVNTYAPGARLEVYGPSAGTIAQFIGLTDTFQGMAIAAADASASAYRGIYFDARNENYAAVANFIADINTDGSSSWVWGVQRAGTRTDRRFEAMRLNPNGFLNIGSVNDYAMLDVRRSDAGSGYPTAYILRENNTGAQTLITKHSSASFGTTVQLLYTTRSQSVSHQFILCASNADATADTEFYVRGDGATFADGSYTGTGADYAEFFEWLDGNPNNEDRRGLSVVLENGKIKPASNTDTNIIGVISANPTVVGDAAWSSWQGKYLTDEYGSPVMEDCEVWEWTGYEETTDPNGNPTTKEKSHSYYADNVPAGIFVPEDKTVTIQERWKLNPEFDPSVPYVNRADRKEWSTVGLMGKLRVRKGQPVGDRWIKLKDVTETVEEWLIR